MITGIDISSYQSTTLDLSGKDFCFVKATEGTSYINPKQMPQAAHARASGLVLGWYHFLRPGDMRAQARYFVEKCGSIPGDLLWADWEDARVSCGDKDTFIKEVLRLRGSSHRVGLYCNTDFWLRRDSTSYCGEALWIAQYNGRPGKPSIQHPWKFHQYTSSPIDTSVGAFRSRAALKSWTAKQVQDHPKQPQQPEDNMAISDADAHKIALAVANLDIVDVPGAPQSNPTYQIENALTEIMVRIDKVTAQVDRLTRSHLAIPDK